MNIDALPFLGAVHRRARSTTPTLIVLHSGETNEGDTAAEGMAAYFASGNTKGSAHICVDNNSVIRCAYDNERTNGAGGVNDIGLHLEQAGRAGQSASDWDDPYSRGVVANAAEVIKGWRDKYPHIPLEFLSAADLRAGRKLGVTTHAQVSQVFAGNDGHWDPGPHYPIDRLFALAGGQATVPLPPPLGDSMTFLATIDGETWYLFAQGHGVRQIDKGRAQFSTATKLVVDQAEFDFLVKACAPSGVVSTLKALWPRKAERAGL